MENPLISTQKSSDSGLQAVLHPLVLLTISDYITRHTLREQKGPIVGALMGQQNGREITIEHAFECATTVKDGNVVLEPDWFATRLDQMKTIHKAPQLDLVGWYTVTPKTGPMSSVLPIHNWLLSEHNESSLLLAFHSEEAVDHSAGSKLPLTIYESNFEVDEPKADNGEDKEMRDGDAPLKLKFRELPYSVETGEAEMVSMDFVVRGAGNATAVETKEQKKPQMVAVDTDPKGKRRIVSPDNAEDDAAAATEEHVLSPEDEELIMSLTGKANAIKMLQSRIQLLVKYLEQLPPSFTGGNTTAAATEPSSGATPHSTPSHTILRSIQALANRLALIVPSATGEFEQEMLSERNDVQLMSLLNEVMSSSIDARNIAKKHSAVEGAKGNSRKGMHDMGSSSNYNMAGPGDLTI
ncbi:COP9 signalosome complex subunit 6 [Apiospora marii]|uniref:COP9 signalosome complex subunit 6 n=1 Tax=Apiospora marii TaxID=335849 RepID=A0ABR1SG62_9PEZI